VTKKSRWLFAASSDEALLQAKDDLESIADYIHQKNPEAALRVRDAIIDSLLTLVLFPRIGRRQNVSGVRKILTRRYRYFVYYSVDDLAEEIVILTIQHPARKRQHSDA
jgi:plasmid stabilization system protein ParE